MIKSSIEKIANEIGFDIGMSDDITQAKLLNGFFDGIGTIKDTRNMDMQLAYIAEHLTKTTENIIVILSEYIQLNQEQRNVNK